MSPSSVLTSSVSSRFSQMRSSREPESIYIFNLRTYLSFNFSITTLSLTICTCAADRERLFFPHSSVQFQKLVLLYPEPTPQQKQPNNHNKNNVFFRPIQSDPFAGLYLCDRHAYCVAGSRLVQLQSCTDIMYRHHVQTSCADTIPHKREREQRKPGKGGKGKRGKAFHPGYHGTTGGRCRR